MDTKILINFLGFIAQISKLCTALFIHNDIIQLLKESFHGPFELRSIMYHAQSILKKPMVCY